MATRYFKRKEGREVCTMSSGNRSKVPPSGPGYPYDWVEIERKEFVRLRAKIKKHSAQDTADVKETDNAER